MISGLRDSNAGRYLQMTAPISEGSSGGGLFDINGRLIGIVSFSFSVAQNLNFAVPADSAVDLVKKALSAIKGRAAPPVELPPSMTKQWWPLFLK